MNPSSLLPLWNRLRRLPGGKRIFSQILAWGVPYTGSIYAIVDELEPGKCVTRMTERRAIRNHLNSVHAMALANLGEMTSGLAVIVGLPSDARGIVIGFDVQYLKKGRGRLTARVSLPRLPTNREENYRAETQIFNESGEHVVTTTATWKIGPRTQ